MLKIDKTCIDLFFGYILICLLEGDKKQFGFFFNFTTCTTLTAVDTNVNNIYQLFKMPKLIILYIKNQTNEILNFTFKSCLGPYNLSMENCSDIKISLYIK